jgi:hypothetical protein
MPLRLRELEFISELVSEIRESKEEALYGYCMDFFDVARLEQG